jgi:ferritin-like metal-binding protein YciE
MVHDRPTGSALASEAPPSDQHLLRISAGVQQGSSTGEQWSSIGEEKSRGRAEWNIRKTFQFSMLHKRGAKSMSTSAARDNLIAWLRDAHAMEEQAETMLTAQHRRLQTYPELKDRIGEHIEETKQHAALLQSCLDRLGDGRSTVKVMAAKLTAMAQGLSGVFVSDEVVKGSLAGYTFEHMEIASYRILIAAADYVGDEETKAVCQRILDEEIAMATWLEENIGTVTQEYLRRDENDLEAKR